MTAALSPEVREFLERQQRETAEQQLALYKLMPQENQKFFDLMSAAGFDPMIESVELSDLRSAQTVLPPAAYPLGLHGELLVPVAHVWLELSVICREMYLLMAGARQRGAELTALAQRPFNSYRPENQVKLYTAMARAAQKPEPRPS
jgi:hypothetical protein